jgi:hypothetical protein
MQGDLAVGRVAVEPPNAPAYFSRDGRTSVDPNDFHRLDLVLASGASMTWSVDLPPDTRRAVFSTVVRAASGDTQLGRAARVSIAAEGSSVLVEERAFLPRDTAHSLSVDLSSLAGKKITLRLAAEETQAGAIPLIFEAPRVLMTLDPGQNRNAS